MTMGGYYIFQTLLLASWYCMLSNRLNAYKIRLNPFLPIYEFANNMFGQILAQLKPLIFTRQLIK